MEIYPEVEKVIRQYNFGSLDWVDEEAYDAIQTLVEFIEDLRYEEFYTPPVLGCSCPTYWWGRGIDWRCDVHQLKGE